MDGHDVRKNKASLITTFVSVSQSVRALFGCIRACTHQTSMNGEQNNVIFEDASYTHATLLNTLTVWRERDRVHREERVYREGKEEGGGSGFPMGVFNSENKCYVLHRQKTLDSLRTVNYDDCMSRTRASASNLWTLVQHSGFGYGDKTGFEHGVEVTNITEAEAKKVRHVGGVVFEDYKDAADAEDHENYPPEVKGMYPAARGEFAKLTIRELHVYLPARTLVKATA